MSNFGFDPQTPILMADGTVKLIGEINIGDLVFGEDKLSHRVLTKTVGTDRMYLIKQNKGIDYIVTSNYILVLRSSGVKHYVIPRSNAEGYRLVYHKKCLNSCSKKNCSKKAFKSREVGFKSLKQARLAELKLENGTFDKDYVRDSEIFEMTIEEFSNICTAGVKKCRLKGYKIPRPVLYQDLHLPLDPYFLGIWLGDGNSDGAVITSADQEIEDYLKKFVVTYDDIILIKTTFEAGSISSTDLVALKDYHTYRLTTNDRTKINPINNCLRQLNIFKNKHIPDIYLNSSEKDRFGLLAGLLDTDGCLSQDECNSQYMFRQSKNKILVEQIKHLAETLGLIVTPIMEKQVPPMKYDTFRDGEKLHTHYIIYISGERMLEIPCLIERKKASIHCSDVSFYNCHNSSIWIEPISEYQGRKCDQYINITIEGCNRVLLSDCTVVHV